MFAFQLFHVAYFEILRLQSTENLFWPLPTSMTSASHETLQSQIYLLKAENERLVQENQAQKRQVVLLEQKIESMTSLLTMYQLNELSVYPKEKSSDVRESLPSFDSLPQLVDRLGKHFWRRDFESGIVSRSNMSESQDILSGPFKKNVLKMGEDIMVKKREYYPDIFAH